jgi:DNA (cytosine-5)-methyltransferase 1
MEYGNIPQNRERIFMICFDKNNKDLGISNFSKSDMDVLLRVQPIPLTKSIHDLIDQNKQDEIYYYKPTHKYYEQLKTEMKNRDTVYQWRRVYVRENKSNVCPTLTANMGTGGHNVPLILDNYGIRKLTPRECARFQGFPDTFKFPVMANSQLYKQIGNSVSVPVIERLATRIINIVNKSVNLEREILKTMSLFENNKY